VTGAIEKRKQVREQIHSLNQLPSNPAREMEIRRLQIVAKKLTAKIANQEARRG
jgi:hypothetical protein